MAIKSADVLPIATYKGQEYCYFNVQAKTNLLSTFGGFLDPNERVSEGASRECKEESLGVFDCSSHHLRDPKKSIRVTHLAHVTFLSKIDIKNKNVMKEFEKIRKKKFAKLKPCQKEVKEIVAISKKTLIDGLLKGQTSFQGHSFRSCVFHNLTKLVGQKILK